MPLIPSTPIVTLDQPAPVKNIVLGNSISVLDLYDPEHDAELNITQDKDLFGAFISQARCSKPHVSLDQQIANTELERLRRYMLKWHNIVSRYCGPLPEIRHAHEMLLRMYYGTFTLLAPLQHARETMDTLKGRLDRRLKAEYTETHKIIRAFLITMNPLCSYSSDCSDCVFTHIYRLRLHQTGVHPPIGLYKCGAPDRDGIPSVTDGVFSPAVGKLKALAHRSGQSHRTLVRMSMLHMKTMRRILKES
jgi:hypothetical protein